MEIEQLKDYIIRMQENELSRLSNDLSNIIAFSQLLFGIVAIIATLAIAYMTWTNRKVKKQQVRAQKDIKSNGLLLEKLESVQEKLDKKENYLQRLTAQLNQTLDSGEFKERLKELETIMTEYKSTEWQEKITNIQDKLDRFPRIYPIAVNQPLAYEYENLRKRSNSLDSDIYNNMNLNNIQQRLRDLENDVIYFERKANSPHFREDF